MSCVLPFINLEARTNGTIGVCCIMQENAIKDDGTEFNLANGDTLSDVKNSKWLKRIQRDFESGKKLKSCNNCWNEEKSGIQSKRQRENIYWKWHNTQEGKVLALDLKLGNICNSKCRICSSFASSQWVAEEIKWEPATAENKKRLNKLGQWPETNEAFWEDIDNYLPTVEKLEFYGGEPFLIERHFDILERCIELGVAHKIAISYNTNGSIYPEDHVHLWKHFKHIEIFVSIDDVYERFNYIRHPGDFHSVIENLQKFKALTLDKSAGSYSIGIFQTISIYNICNLNELTTYVHDYIDVKIPIHYNMLFTPAHNCIKLLPAKAKEHITKKYANSPVHIQNIVKFMNGEDYDESALFTFIQMTKFSDNLRKEKFTETFPELYELLKENWNE